MGKLLRLKGAFCPEKETYLRLPRAADWHWLLLSVVVKFNLNYHDREFELLYSGKRGLELQFSNIVMYRVIGERKLTKLQEEV